MPKKAPKTKNAGAARKRAAAKPVKKSGPTNRSRTPQRATPAPTPPAAGPSAHAAARSSHAGNALVPGGYQPDPKAISTYGTTEDDRGGPFFEKLRMWRIFHDDRGKTTFTKAELEKLYYEDHADRQKWFTDQLGSAASNEVKATIRKEKAKEQQSRRRHVERLVEILKKIDIPIDDVDKRDRPIDDKKLKELQEEDPFAERRWKYNPDGEWARQLDELLDTHDIHGYELVGMMACRSLLEDLGGLPQLAAVRTLVDKMTGLLPPDIRESAIEQSRAWRYSLGNTSKYSSPEKKIALTSWYEATITLRQVDIEHRAPGKPPRTRRIAATAGPCASAGSPPQRTRMGSVLRKQPTASSRPDTPRPATGVAMTVSSLPVAR